MIKSNWIPLKDVFRHHSISSFGSIIVCSCSCMSFNELTELKLTISVSLTPEKMHTVLQLLFSLWWLFDSCQIAFLLLSIPWCAHISSHACITKYYCLAHCMAHQIFRTLHLYKVCVLGRCPPPPPSWQFQAVLRYNCSSEITGRREVGGMACTDQRLYCCICSIRSLFSLLPYIQSTPTLRCCGTWWVDKHFILAAFR